MGIIAPDAKKLLYLNRLEPTLRGCGGASGNCKRKRTRARGSAQKMTLKFLPATSDLLRSPARALRHAAARFARTALLLLLAAPAGAAIVDEDGVPLNVYMTGAEVRID